jgi:hypothetical protein
MNLNPKIWGPHTWFFLDSIMLSLPNKLNNEQQNIYKNFFTSLQYILPCEGCRDHYAENLKQYPLTEQILSNKENMIKWLLNIHNSVRKQNKTIPISIKQFFEYYYKQYDDKKNKQNKKKCNYKYNLCIIIILLLLLLIIYKFRS